MKQQELFSGVSFDARVVLTGDWPHEVLVQAGRLHARLVMLGWRKEKPFGHRFRRSRIERVLRHATCDIAVFRVI